MRARTIVYSSVRMILFVLIATGFASANAGPELVRQANQNAIEIAPQITGTNVNHYNVSEDAITQSNPIKFFFARLVGMYPSANTAISSREETKLLFAWGESHEPSYEIIGYEHHPDCNQPIIKLTEISGKTALFNFTFKLTNGNMSLEKIVISNGADNPLQMPFSKEELDSISPDMQIRKMPLIETHLNASVTYHYKIRTIYEEHTCATLGNGAISCSCVQKAKIEYSDFTRYANDSMEYIVENGAPAGVLAQPAGFEQSSGATGTAQSGMESQSMIVPFFSSRNISRAEAEIDNESVEMALAGYYRQDLASFAWIALANITDNASAVHGRIGLMQNKSYAWGRFSSIVNQSYPVAYVYTFTISAQNLSLGKHNLTITAEDMFGWNDTYNTLFYKKAQSALALDCAGAELMASLSDQAGLPISNADIISGTGAQITGCVTGADGKCRLDSLSNTGSSARFSSARFAGNEKYFGAYAECAGKKPMQDGFIYGVVLASLILGFAVFARDRKR